MNWIKQNWLSLLAVVLSVTALVRCEPFTFNETNFEWIIATSVAIISVGLVAVMGFQFYNAFSLDKRMRDMFDEKTKEVRDDIASSAIKSDAGVLYQVNGLKLKFYFATKNYNDMLGTLKCMTDDAVTMNKQELLSDTAKIVINTHKLIERDAPKFLQESSVLDQILTVSLAVQNSLLSSDVYARPLMSLIDSLKDSLADQQKECSLSEKKKEVL